MTYLTVGIVIYSIIAFIMYGFFFAWWQGEYPLIASTQVGKDIIDCICYGIIWPITLLAHLCTWENPFKHGWRLK